VWALTRRNCRLASMALAAVCSLLTADSTSLSPCGSESTGQPLLSTSPSPPTPEYRHLIARGTKTHTG
jgi:hypothetical protein